MSEKKSDIEITWSVDNVDGIDKDSKKKISEALKETLSAELAKEASSTSGLVPLLIHESQHSSTTN